MQNSGYGFVRFVPYVLLSFLMLVVFAYFQLLAIDDRNFVLLTFSSYIFLGIGTVLLFHAGTIVGPRKWRVLVNAVASIFIAVILFSAISLSDVPRGGGLGWHDSELGAFELPLEKGSWSEGNRIVYGYSAHRSESIFSANYPVGFVHVSPEWDAGLRIDFREPINLNGSIFTQVVFYPAVENQVGIGFTQGTFVQPIYVVDGESDWIRIDNGFMWGSTGASSRRFRVEGYRIMFDIYVYFEEETDYGSTINSIVHPSEERFLVLDYAVNSKLQNTAAMLLNGVFFGAVCYIPFKSIKPKLDQNVTPKLNTLRGRLEGALSVKEETPKAFLKKCLHCGEEIPIASEYCPFCQTKQS